ncbi:MAG TPA: ABC transporter substrate-binding protein, partial [Paenalcaligenes sp.]|nr:ABC transporter substrate-binding protein [Paenalcaligenes sp.]
QAMDFVAFTTGTQPLAGFEDVAYGPTRQSSLDLVDDQVLPYLPSSHLEVGLKADGLFWADYGESLGEKFHEWLLR